MKVLLGMSGGLDSTYAAIKLKSLGYEVEGAVLMMHGHTDIAAAKEAARSVDIPLHVVDCAELFEEKVVTNFICEYSRAKTPNPCIVCNREVKFAVLLDIAEKMGFDAIATGHYAKIVEIYFNGDKRFALARSKDFKKDQTYMLWCLPQKVLEKLVFPLGDDIKSDIKDSAKEIGLNAADKDESQEICFVPDGDYADFIENRMGSSAIGNFVDKEGNILGKHKGIIRYTVGQRKGLGVAAGKRMFVTKINPDTQEILLQDSPALSNVIEISDMVFSVPSLCPGEKMNLQVKVRYLAPLVPCELEYLGQGRGRVYLSEPAKSVTPGQSCVFYHGDVLICGGFTDAAYMI